MMLKIILLAVSGFGAGAMVAGGIFALVVGLKIVPRFAECTHTAHRVQIYEMCICFGGILGCVVNIYDLPVRTGPLGLVIFGFVGGVYVGAWAMALAEIVDTIPIFARRISLKNGFNWIVLMMALGRTFGSILQFYNHWW